MHGADVDSEISADKKNKKVFWQLIIYLFTLVFKEEFLLELRINLKKIFFGLNYKNKNCILYRNQLLPIVTNW